MKTPCAFHQGQIITHFCKCSSCLLPLCQQCINIHHKQHIAMPQQMLLMPIESVHKDTIQIHRCNNHINSTSKTIQINKYRESDEQHKHLFQQIIHQQEALINTIKHIYQNMFRELQANSRRRDAWIREFTLSVKELKEQMSSLANALSGEKYLRNVIMWNRMKPHQTIQNIAKKSQKDWVVPTFTGCSKQIISNFVVANTNLKVLQIQGDSGINKILHIIKVLRYGQDESAKNSKVGMTNKNISIPTQNFKNSAVNVSPSTINNSPHPNSQISQPPTPLFFSPSNRKSSTKKLQVLSTLEQFKSHSNIMDNDKLVS